MKGTDSPGSKKWTQTLRKETEREWERDLKRQRDWKWESHRDRDTERDTLKKETDSGRHWVHWRETARKNLERHLDTSRDTWKKATRWRRQITWKSHTISFPIWLIFQMSQGLRPPIWVFNFLILHIDKNNINVTQRTRTDAQTTTLILMWALCR